MKIGDKVRFKTEIELIKELGENWREIRFDEWNSDGDMDYLFGKEFEITEVSYECVKEIDERVQKIDGWHVFKSMLVPVFTLEDYVSKYGNSTVDELVLNKLLGVKESKVWLPKDGETYCFKSYDSDILEWTNNSTMDESITKHNRVFETHEEASSYAEKQAFIIQMERDFINNSEELDWIHGNRQDKYYIQIVGDKLIIAWAQNNKTQGSLYTTDEEWLKQYIIDNKEMLRKIL